ncbi:hypothetical protein B0T11DRAFT_312700 [Plectosphaerella cucumerina]|uniref:Uncharacterized protein n=1 Tax=Plectosphaerella cucumerina TaxID=40658 RepID=A0A8K0T5K6_9PEZI|nr:hypothetical protein B0T11DRAFT_312700 [Plectosphaerella cucumerina]
MASLASACRLSARMVTRRVPGESAVRGFRSSARCLAAQNFTMPALSPTMTEGNIATWKVKDGETFSAGDVLLEIETDKATMDVEAQEDGIMMKIISGDGSKAVQVGTRIAVLAEAGDDISALEIPADEAQKQEAPKETAQKQESAPSTDESSSAPSKKSAAPPSDGKRHQQKYPLYPSVQSLITHHKLDADAVASITPTGPQGRLLKGDVLAFVGSINAETPGKITERFQKLAALDLSNIKVAPKKEAKKPAAPAKEAAPAPRALEVSVPVTLAKVIEVQRRIQDTLGVFLPVSTFIARASEVANDDLPASSRNPTADELFNQVLGLDKLGSRVSRGAYLPQIEALPEASFLSSRPAAPRAQSDIIDILSGSAKKTPAPRVPETVAGVSAKGTNVFTLVVPQGDEQRASIFLQRVKAILEKDPGRLVL